MTTPVPEGTSSSHRLRALDIARGIVMVLMAIDHVRNYAGLPPGGPTPDIFFTRWITHFAAPAFCFLAGTGAFLHGRRLADRAALSRYLFERGALLVILELTLFRWAWTFNFDYAHFIQGNVIWVLGWSMIVLAILVRFSLRTISIFGLGVIFAQQLITVAHSALSESASAATSWFWQILYVGGRIDLGGTETPFIVIYSLVPWIGVMAVGYAFGAVMIMEPERRRRACLTIGLSATALFIIGAGITTMLQTPGPNDPPALLRFLGQRKYPASQLYLMMTLGPTIALLPLLERLKGWASEVLVTFGRVPLFYYLLHIVLIHTLAIGVSLVRGGTISSWLFANHPWGAGAPPDGYTWSFGLLYFVFVVAVTLLYFPCRWYGEVKARHKNSWLSYF